MATIPPASPYTKPALSPADLLKHLVDRGLSVPTPQQGIDALAVLERIGYYRLLAYMRPLQRFGADRVRRFVPGTTMDDVLDLYEFDRKLRLVCMDAVERIEVALRAAIVSEVAVRHGAHFYMDRVHFTSDWSHNRFLEAVRDEAGKHAAAKHYHRRYDSPALPPIWVAMEGVTFGTLSHLFSNLIRKRRREIAARLGYDESILKSWFRAVNFVRNVAAHHGRLWNAGLSVDKPQPGAGLAAEFPTQLDTFAARAVVFVALLRSTGWEVEWKAELLRLLAAHPSAGEAQMGFPVGWRDRAFWAVPASANAEVPVQPTGSADTEFSAGGAPREAADAGGAVGPSEGADPATRGGM